MIAILAIFQYVITGLLDLTDKFLISGRKIQPASYTFWTVVTGALLLLVWPWTYLPLRPQAVLWGLLSGAVFSLALYVFYRALSEGEASRVVPYVFGIVPVFDLLLVVIAGNGVMSLTEYAAVFLLIPGALLLSFSPSNFSRRHIALGTVSAVIFSVYFWIWQTAAVQASAGVADFSAAGAALTFNGLIWNRIGAALVLLLLLPIPKFRREVFGHDQIKNKKQTSLLFAGKQLLGGANFLFYSWLLGMGKVPVLNALQGFRYITVLGVGWLLAYFYPQWQLEFHDRRALKLKLAALFLIFAGTAILFRGGL